MRKNTALNASCGLVLLLVLALGFGCAPKSRGISDSTAEGYGYGKSDQGSSVDKRVRDYLAAEKEDPRGRDVLISTAKTALGTPYVRGGTSTDGFDCSGFVQWTFNQVGVKLPRTAREQSRVGKAIRDIDDVQVGDIVAFHHPKRGYHTGIYVGDGKFIHSPRKRTRVRINSMDDPYFSKTFMGARRIGVSSPEDIEAAERMLAEYREKEVSRSRSKESRSKAVASAATKRSKKESARSSRSGKSKESASSRKSSGNKSVGKDSRDSKGKKSVGQARSPASQMGKTDRSKGSVRASNSTSAGKQGKGDQSKKSSAQKSQKSSDKKSADSKSSTKSSASKTGNSPKKGS